MAAVRLGTPLQAAELRTGPFVDLLRSFPAQARLALGVGGVAWATAAAVVGLTCCGVSFALVALSLHATEVEHRQQNATEVLALDQATRKLLRTVHLMSYGERQPAEVQIPLQQAWPQFKSALTTVCEQPGGVAANTDLTRSACATGSAMRDILAPEIDAFDPPGRLIDPSTFGKVIALVGDFNGLSAVVAGDANVLVGRMVDNYRTALLVLTLSTVGFAGAGLVLILLVGRTSMRHFEQWRQATEAARQAGEARDMLQETVDALPAGVVLYDRQERLVMFNTAAVAASPLLKRPDIIGITYEELARETGKLGREFGAPLVNTPDEWIERFRSKGARRMRQSVEGHWFEWSEKLTASGRTVGLRVDVTELKTRELELERAGAEYESLVESLSDVVYALNIKGVFTFVSAAAAELLGVPASHMIGKRFWDYVAPEDVEQTLAAGRALLKSASLAVHQAQIRMIAADGTIRHVEVRYRKRVSGVTRDAAQVGVIRDISERVEFTRQLEKHATEVEHARAEYQSLVDSLSDMVHKVEPRTATITFASAASVEVLGWPPSQLVGTSALDHIVADDVEYVVAETRAALADPLGQVRQFQYRARTASGAERHVEVRTRRMRGTDGRPVVAGVMHDVEESVQLQRKLDAEMARLRSIVESSGAMIVLVDRALGVVMVNSEFTAVTGLGAEHAVGHPLKQVADWPLDAAVLAAWYSDLPGRDGIKPARFATRMRDQQGRQRLIAVTATPVADERGRVNSIVFLGVDDTERRETEEALFDAERLAIVGEMAATVAHEVAQPLQVINIACASVHDELAEAAGRNIALDREFVEQKIDRIDSQVERAGRIISELRAFVRGTSQEMPGRFDPTVAVRGAVDLTQHAVRAAGVALSASMACDLPTLVGHVGKLEQVLVNLINNACDAGGRSVEVSAAALYREGTCFVRISVEDDGPGIFADVLPRLFESFITTKARGKGTGLGLRICRRIVEEMGGSIAAANRAEQRGACFEILLPAAPDDA